ncbi:MAG: glycosyltransferase family 4 protein [Desulfobacterales bacterium]
MNPAPNICIITETYYPVVGGGETQARALAEGLSARGFAVFVLTRRSHESFPKIEQVGPITVFRLPPKGRAHYWKWGLLVTGLTALIGLRSRCDVIFVSGFRVLGVPAVIAGKLLDKPCILKADSLGEMSGAFFAGGLAKWGWRPTAFPIRAFLKIRNKILNQADVFVAVCKDIAEELTKHGLDSKRICRIPNGVDTRTFCPVSTAEKRCLRSKLSLPRDDTIVTYSGRLVAYKGLPLLMTVWNELQKQRKRATLLLLGSGGLDIHNCEGELKSYVNMHGLRNRVIFTGEVRNVHEYLQASDIFIFPTQNEAFGLSLVEAMACGLPCISTAVGGILDIVTHLHDGVLVRSGDFRQTRQALDDLMTDTALADRLGNAAVQTVRDTFSMENVTRSYECLFAEIARSSGNLFSRAEQEAGI